MFASAYALYVLVPAVLYLVVLVPAARDGRRAPAYATAALGLVLLALMVLFALIIYGLRCDESCNENMVPSVRQPGWQYSLHAWQWGVQLALALAAFVAGFLPIALIRFRQERAAAVAAVLTAALSVAWVLLLLTGQ